MFPVLSSSSLRCSSPRARFSVIKEWLRVRVSPTHLPGGVRESKKTRWSFLTDGALKRSSARRRMATGWWQRSSGRAGGLWRGSCNRRCQRPPRSLVGRSISRTPSTLCGGPRQPQNGGNFILSPPRHRELFFEKPSNRECPTRKWARSEKSANEP